MVKIFILVQKIVIWANFRFKPLFRAKRVIYPSGKEKPATGLKMGKLKKRGNPANPAKQSFLFSMDKSIYCGTKIIIFQSQCIQPR